MNRWSSGAILAMHADSEQPPAVGLNGARACSQQSRRQQWVSLTRVHAADRVILLSVGLTDVCAASQQRGLQSCRLWK